MEPPLAEEWLMPTRWAAKHGACRGQFPASEGATPMPARHEFHGPPSTPMPQFESNQGAQAQPWAVPSHAILRQLAVAIQVFAGSLFKNCPKSTCNFLNGSAAFETVMGAAGACADAGRSPDAMETDFKRRGARSA